MMRLLEQLYTITPNRVAGSLTSKATNRWIDPIIRWAEICLVALFLSVGAGAVAGVVWAQGATQDEVNSVARELWCPLCSGVRLDSCELKACDQMKDVIAIKLDEGADTESIKAYFVEQYGPQVLGEPPREGFNWLAWVLPFLVLIAGGIFLWAKTRQMVHSAAATQARAQAGQSHGQPLAEAPQEEYARKLDEELAKYG
jgi:cytochrome c-type biogenesis protein CcmH